MLAWRLAVVATPERLEVAIGRDEKTAEGPGAPPKNAARAHYERLMKQGIGNSEACRIVGISRSSGTRWRHGHTVVLKRPLKSARLKTEPPVQNDSVGDHSGGLGAYSAVASCRG